jgi:hypothetical protein
MTDEPRICEWTNVALVPFPEFGTWRVYQAEYELVTGRARESSSPLFWSRFELPDRTTRYSATLREGAFKDALAEFRYLEGSLAEYVRSKINGISATENPIKDEWGQLGHMLPGCLPKVWRFERTVAQLMVSNRGWFVDVEHERSRQAITKALKRFLSRHKIDMLDVATLRSNRRDITCAVAGWLEQQYLDDGSVPLGIRYTTSYGDTEWESWAAFPETTVRIVDRQPIPLDDPDLKAVADLWNLRPF